MSASLRIVRSRPNYFRKQTVSFYEAPVDQFGRGSLQAQFDADPIPVLTHTLDYLVGEQMIERVDVIKVDVEGFEAWYFKAR